MKKCLSLIRDAVDREILEARLSERGVNPEARMSAILDSLEQVQQEHQDFLDALKNQHENLFKPTPISKEEILKFAELEQEEPKSVTQRLAEVFGQAKLKKMLELGLLKIHERGGGGLAASWDGKSINLYPHNMMGEDPVGFVFHEAEHAGLDTILGDSYSAFQEKFNELLSSGNEIAKAAEAKAERLALRPEHIPRERLAYFIQGAWERQKDLTGPAHTFFMQLVNRLKAWIRTSSFGKALANAGIEFEITDGYAIALAERALNQSIKDAESEFLEATELASFAGEFSETSNIGRLNLAKGMLERGANPEWVQQRLGWFKGPDGKWRYEISDGFFSVDFNKLQDLEVTSLGNLVQHPLLFEAYPWLKNIRVVPTTSKVKLGGFDFNLDAWQLGDLEEYQKRPGTLKINKKWAEIAQENNKVGEKARDLLEVTIIHEIQHAIQQFEGFTGGGNVQSFIDQGMDPRTALMKYMTILGEQEARIVADRRKLSQLERRESPVDLTIPDSDLKKYAEEFNLGIPDVHLDSVKTIREFNDIRVMAAMPQLADIREFFFGDEVYSPEKMSRFNKVRTYLQDRLIELKEKQDKILQEGGTITNAQRAYEAEETSHGRKTDRQMEFQINYVDPMLKILNGLGVSQEEAVKMADEFVYARHAQEANDAGRRRNSKQFLLDLANELPAREQRLLRKEMADIIRAHKSDRRQLQEEMLRLLEANIHRGSSDLQNDWTGFNERPSGMSDEEANDILLKYAANPEMQRLGDLFDRMNRSVIDWYRQAGMLSLHQANMWKTHQHYATLRREGFENETSGTGRGYSAGRPSAIRAYSTRRAFDVFTNTIWKAEEAIQKTENNRVVRALAELVEANPDPDFWVLQGRDKVSYLDQYGFVQYGPTKALGKGEIRYWKFGKPFLVRMVASNEKAMSIANAMNNLDSPRLGPVLNFFRRANKWMAFVNTSASPEFFFSNLPRDFFTAQFNMNDTEAVNVRKAINGYYIGALKGLKKTIRAKGRQSYDLSDEWVQWARKFEAAGGRTGWMDIHQDINDRRVKLEKRMRQLKPGVHRTVHEIARFIEDYNAVAENAIRLSAFRALTENGVAERRAVSIVKDITTNFNRKGNAGNAINALYMFAGAGIQGSARILTAIKNSRKVRAMVYGTIATSFVVDQINRAFSDDEDDDGKKDYDEIPSYTKERNLVFLNPFGGSSITIPAPWGYNTVWAIGQKISEAFSSANGDLPDWSALGAAADLASTAFNAFMPISGGTFLQVLSPTFFDPLVMIGENKDAFGADLRPEPFPNEKRPYSQQYWSTVSDFSKVAAREINELFGGDEIKPGLIDFSPEWLDVIAAQIGGSAWRTVKQAGYDVPKGLLTEEDLELREVPIARKLVTAKSNVEDSILYHDRVSQVLTLEKQINHYSEPGQNRDVQRARELREENQQLYSLVPLVKLTESRLRHFRKLRRNAESRGDTARAKTYKDKITEIQEDFNKRFRQRVGS